MNPILNAWNEAEERAAIVDLMHCCAAQRWAHRLVAMRAFGNEESLFRSADLVWDEMGESDWMEAFSAHPWIGEGQAIHASAQSTAWSRAEQAAAASAKSEVLDRLSRLNSRYEERYGFTYIVCATGKTAEEMLHTLERRLAGDRDGELREAAEQQRQIMQIRMRKWLLP